MRTTESANGELLPALPLAEHLTLEQVRAQRNSARRAGLRRDHRLLITASADLELALHPELVGQSENNLSQVVDSVSTLLENSDETSRLPKRVLTQARLWWACIDDLHARIVPQQRLNDISEDVGTLCGEMLEQSMFNPLDSETLQSFRVVAAIALASHTTTQGERNSLVLYPSTIREMDGHCDIVDTTASHTLYMLDTSKETRKKVPLKITRSKNSRGRKSSGGSMPTHPSVKRLPWPRLYKDDQPIIDLASSKYPGIDIPDAVTLAALGALANEADGSATRSDHYLIDTLQENLFTLLRGIPSENPIIDSIQFPPNR